MNEERRTRKQVAPVILSRVPPVILSRVPPVILSRVPPVILSREDGEGPPPLVAMTRDPSTSLGMTQGYDFGMTQCD
jgi:hypothetical protein